MAKKKTEDVVENDIWQQIIESVNEENKEDVLGELQSAADFLGESPNGDQGLRNKFIETIEKIKKG